MKYGVWVYLRAVLLHILTSVRAPAWLPRSAAWLRDGQASGPPLDFVVML